MRPKQQNQSVSNTLSRVKFWYACLLVIAGIFLIRLFYLQVIRHSYYQQAALRGQLKQYEIQPERGTIIAHNGTETTPIVLNQTLYTLYADPKFIKDAPNTAQAVQKVIGGDTKGYKTKMTANSRYEILGKKLSKQQSDVIRALKLKGIGTQPTNYRTYPQGQLAAQVLGFVNDEGDGQYGIEQVLNNQLKGKAGSLKAITDAQGVPLAANKENVVVNPEPGKKILLTLDLGMQQQLEDILKKQIDETKASSGSALIMDANTGAIKAMSNYPTFNPADFSKVENQSLFRNAVVTDAFEVGSIMKTLTAVSAFDQGVVSKDSTYYDPGEYVIDGSTITNTEYGGAGTKSIADIFRLSLNTGATWMLTQMGGGQINQKARETWHDYLTNHYQFGKPTGVEQSNEGAGLVPDPNKGFGLNLQYANTAFGQGQTETVLQMGAAIASAVNGGTYYKPRLVDAYIQPDGSIKNTDTVIVRKDVVSKHASQDLRELMELTAQKNKLVYGTRTLRDEYAYGGKTGTAQISNPAGGYYDNQFEGTFLGYIGGDMPEYVIVVRVTNARKISGFAGSKAAAPVFFSLADMLINNFGVKPKTK